MAQLIVRKLDDRVKERLLARAKLNGRTLEAEARAILEEVATASGFSEPPVKTPAKSRAKRRLKKEKGFGSLMHARFRKVGLTEEEWKLFNEGIEELRRGDVFKPVDFDE